MWGRYLFLYPLFASIGIPITFLISYGISLSLDHIVPFVPFISYTGNLQPESCIFGQFLNLFSLLIGVSVYIRYRQVDEGLKSNPYRDTIKSHKAVHRLNIITLVLGILIAICLSIVANFQRSSISEIHLLGAGGSYVLSAFYALIQTILSYQLVSIQTKQIIKHIRAVITGLIIISSITIAVATLISDRKYTGTEADKLKWTANDGGFTEHVVAATGQWITTGLIMLYILTFISDFHTFGLKSPEFYLISKNRVGDVSGVKHQTL